MKKYDLILAVLYILPVILGFIIFYNLKNPSDQEMEKAGAYIEKLYKQPVSNVVIYNTDMAVRVIESPEKVKQGFKITGVIPFRQVTGFRVAGDTLYVSGPEEYSGVICQLWVSPGVKVDHVGQRQLNRFYPVYQYAFQLTHRLADDCPQRRFHQPLGKGQTNIFQNGVCGYVGQAR